MGPTECGRRVARGAREAGVTRVVLTSAFGAIGTGISAEEVPVQRNILAKSRRQRRTAPEIENALSK